MKGKSVAALMALVAAFAAIGMGQSDDAAESDPPVPAGYAAAADERAGQGEDGEGAAERFPAAAELAAAPDQDAAAHDARQRDDTGDAVSRPAGDGPEATFAPAPPELRFVRWTQQQGLFSAEVPAGWQVEGRIDPQGLDKGAFLIQGYAPDGRAMFSFAHNWLWFMEYQHGRYRPGAATVESLVVPGIAGNLPAMDLRDLRIAYRSRNQSLQLANPATGLPIRADQGTLGLLAANGRGEILAGTLLGETLYVPMGATPGLWSLRIFSGGIAPANSTEQAAIRAIQRRLVDSLQLAPGFVDAWNQAHQHTVRLMREYSRQMDQVFERYLAAARRSNSRESKDPMRAWSEMMREGHYEHDEHTGEEHWVGNNNAFWWKNDQGVIYGNNTGAPPADGSNWYGLSR